MIHFLLYDFPAILIWIFAPLNIVNFFRARRAWRRAQHAAMRGIAEEAGLTPLQAQVAMDAAMATFMARAAEMRDANKRGTNGHTGR
jgi:hypothetical protein